MKASIRVRLKVYPQFHEDVYKDVARINKSDRGNIHQGRICELTVNGRMKRLIVRGIAGPLSGCVMLDDISRDALGLQTGIEYDFEIEETGIVGQIVWACGVADPAARIAAWLGVFSFVLGLLGLILGIVGLLR